jgi:hypothetical protein
MKGRAKACDGVLPRGLSTNIGEISKTVVTAVAHTATHQFPIFAMHHFLQRSMGDGRSAPAQPRTK